MKHKKLYKSYVYLSSTQTQLAFSLLIELMKETTGASFTCVQNTCHHFSKSLMSTAFTQLEWCHSQYNRIVACLTPFPALDKYTHTQTHTLPPGDRCVTAAWQEPGDPTRQTEWPVSQLAGWLTERQDKRSLTVTPAALCQRGSSHNKRKGWMCHSQFTQWYMWRCSDTQRHPGTRDVD